MDFYFENEYGEEVLCKVKGTYYKGHAGSYYDPPEPPEVLDLEVLVDGKDIVTELPESEIERIVDAFIEWNEDLNNYDEEEAWRMRHE
jgi:hypothetical protein